MATATLKDYLSSSVRSTQGTEIEIRTENFLLPYNLYLETVHYDFTEYQSSTNQLIYCLAGKCEVEINSKTFYLTAENILLIEKGTDYVVKVSNKNAIIVKFRLKGNFSWQKQVEQLGTNTPTEQGLSTLFLRKLNQGSAFLFTTTSVTWGSQNLKGIIQDYLDNATSSGMVDLELLKIIILRNLREQNFRASKIREGAFKDEALDQYIDQHYSDISLAQATRYFGFNRNYFSTMVEEKTGKSFVGHADKGRMKEARRLLAEPNVSLKEIVETIGYSNKSFFYKKFKHYYGMTPTEMRKGLFREAHISLK